MAGRGRRRPVVAAFNVNFCSLCYILSFSPIFTALLVTACLPDVCEIRGNTTTKSQVMTLKQGAEAVRPVQEQDVLVPLHLK